MKKVRIIIPYFGKFPSTISVFLSSCEHNKEFEWLIFTDDKLGRVPSNVMVVQCTLEDIKSLITEKLEREIVLDKPYKLCDYRPAYGLIFEEYLKDYDFWGYGDIDLVYGKLSNFITDELLEEYDKIYPCGHLALVRNSKEINRIFSLSIEKTLDYKEVFSDNKSFIFDEYCGINEKLLYLGKKVYGNIEFADMDINYTRFRTADKRTINLVFPRYPFKKQLPLNYDKQLFLYEKGSTYRVFINKEHMIEREELVYIHYRHKIENLIKDGTYNKFCITINGIKEVEKEITEADIVLLNPYPGKIKEWWEYFKFAKEQCVYKLGSNRMLRNLVRTLKGKKRI